MSRAQEQLEALAARIREHERRATAALAATTNYGDALNTNVESTLELLEAVKVEIERYQEWVEWAGKLAADFEAMAKAMERGRCPLCGGKVEQRSAPQSMNAVH
jgi:rRNA maturation endonuclease Nob1